MTEPSENEFADAWSHRRLRDLGTWHGGSTPSKAVPEYWSDEGVPWVTPKDMKSERLADALDHLTEVGASRLGRVPPQSVLVVARSGILQRYLPVAVTWAPVTINQDLKALVPYPWVNAEFVAASLRTFENLILRRCLKEGTTVQSLDSQSLLSFEIPLPQLAEQRHVAEILDVLDAAIRQTEAVIAKLAQVKVGLLHDLLTRGIDDNGELRPWRNGHQHELLAGWRHTCLGAVARVRRGASPRPIDDPQWFAEEGPGWVRIVELSRADRVLLKTEQQLSPLGAERSVAVHPGQVIMSIAATVGEPIIVGIEACIHDGFVVFDRHERDLDPAFLYYWLLEHRSLTRRMGQTGTQSNINADIVRATPIALPGIRVQREIARIASELDDRLRDENKYLGTLNQLKQGLAEELLTGRVRILAIEERSDDKPASSQPWRAGSAVLGQEREEAATDCRPSPAGIAEEHSL
jgi:type I restriction enzyme, S subunit